MKFYVYVLQSELDGSFYKGFSTHPLERLIQHNNGETQSTKRLTPWKLVYMEDHFSKKDALIREKNLKRLNVQELLV